MFILSFRLGRGEKGYLTQYCYSACLYHCSMTSKEDSFLLVVFLFSFIYSGFERTVLSIALLIRLYRLMQLTDIKLSLSFLLIPIISIHL